MKKVMFSFDEIKQSKGIIDTTNMITLEKVSKHYVDEITSCLSLMFEEKLVESMTMSELNLSNNASFEGKCA